MGEGGRRGLSLKEVMMAGKTVAVTDDTFEQAVDAVQSSD